MKLGTEMVEPLAQHFEDLRQNSVVPTRGPRVPGGRGDRGAMVRAGATWLWLRMILDDYTWVYMVKICENTWVCCSMLVNTWVTIIYYMMMYMMIHDANYMMLY